MNSWPSPARRSHPRIQKVPDPTPGKNRVHVDFGAADVDAEVARLVAAARNHTGARVRGLLCCYPDGPPD